LPVFLHFCGLCSRWGGGRRRPRRMVGGPGTFTRKERAVVTGPDRWHKWLLETRFGGDAAAREKDPTGFLCPVRDEVLDRAQLEPGQTLLDVGTGDGLIAFGALERLGPSGRMMFSDTSQDLLDHCRAAAGAGGLLDRCRFVLAPADQLTGVPDASADAVTTDRC
jgi:arsenite methyltransferase